jgi:LuxR family maltose regulon positive regulatory protein
MYGEGIARVHQSGYVNDSSIIHLAEMRSAQGRLHESMRTYERALHEAEATGEPVLKGTADLHVGISVLYRERNELEKAAWHLEKSRELGEAAALPENRHRWFIAMAGIKSARGELDEALDLLNEAERLFAGSFSPDRPAAAMRTSVWLTQGRLAEALAWVREQGLSAQDELQYRREFEHTVLARVLIARAAEEQDERWLHEAEGLLDRLLQSAEDAGRTGSVLEILVLKALARQAGGDVDGAIATIERALGLAEPQGYVRLFLDEGESLRSLLRLAIDRGVGDSYARQLLASFGEPAELAAPASASRTSSGLLEALTPRELEILRLIAEGLRNQEIADQLVISTATVKRHIANAYGKLGASHRTDALRRANELQLL